MPIFSNMRSGSIMNECLHPFREIHHRVFLWQGICISCLQFYSSLASTLPFSPRILLCVSQDSYLPLNLLYITLIVNGL